MGKHFYIILLVFNRKDNIMNHRIQKIHEASIKILSKTGMKYHHPKAIEILKENGISVKGNTAFFTEEELMYWIGKVPSQFRIYAQNPDHGLVFGNKDTHIAPPYGCPSVTEKDGTVRPGTLVDYINMVKLFQVNEDFHINGGLLVQPNDIDIPSSCLSMFYGALTHSDKIMMIPAGKKEQMEAIIDSMALLSGGKKHLKNEPRFCTIVNINTPLQLDITMTDVLFTFAQNGQPFAATSGAMAGSTAPMTLAGTIAMFNAEVLATIALAQMINPGTPVFYGSQATTADMKTGQMACGAAEGVICAKYVSQLAKFYHLPCRGGGAITDAKIVDAQAGMESMMMLMNNFDHGMDLVIHAAGILDSYLSVSFEKIILDFEIIRYIKRYQREFDINDNTIPLDLIREIGHNGEFLTKEHTFHHCRTEPLFRKICSCGKVDDPLHQLSINMEKEYFHMMDQYHRPEIPMEKLYEIKEILCHAGADKVLLDQIETM